MANLHYKLCFYVPTENAEQVKQAVFDTGAGRQGNYEQCCWQTIGQGQFKPIEGADPAIGSVGSLERVEEVKVEVLCEASVIKAAVRALLQSHPYEEPAFDVLQLTDHRNWLD